MKTRAEIQYQDIIDLPHHQSPSRPHMSAEDRAAQFAPFAALTGQEAAVSEAGRYTRSPVALAEDQAAILDEKLRLLARHLAERPEISVTYFSPDGKKAGGRYLKQAGRVRKLDLSRRLLVLEDETRILLDQITDIRTDL